MSSARRRATLAALTVAAVVGVLAPTADAQTRRTTGLRLSAVTGVPSTIAPGERFSLRVTVRNRGTRAAKAPRVLVGLTRGTTARVSASRVGARTLPTFRPGRSTRYSVTVRISSRRTGSYRTVVCATQTGRRARCVLGRRVTVASPTPPPAPVTPALDEQLRTAISAAALGLHASRLYDVALANGNRAAGTQGYDDSAAYVFNTLAKAGYEPRLDRFDFVQYTEAAPPALTVSTGAVTEGEDFTSMEYSGSGDTEALAPTGAKAIVPVDLGVTPTPDTAPAGSNTSGCEAADFAAFPAGAIALVKRGSCGFAVKVANAVAAGASGVIIFNEGQPGREDLLSGTLGAPVANGVAVPVLGTTAALGEALAAAATPTGRIVTDSATTPSSSYNVIADTPGGDASRTIVVGAHLDSVPESPGINDNGSGVAFTLELARQMTALGITPRNRVRFAFWGAGEAGLAGSTAYVAGLSDAAFGQIALNLNFDTLASLNDARLVFDGDFSDTPAPASATLAPGSADIERAFTSYFAVRGLATAPTAFDGRSDYDAFQAAGVPAGGLFSGADEIKPASQVPLFGGTAGVAYDVNHHGPGDGLANLNLTGFEELADAAATIALGYATADTLPAKYAGRVRRPEALRRAAATSLYRGSRLQR